MVGWREKWVMAADNCNKDLSEWRSVRYGDDVDDVCSLCPGYGIGLFNYIPLTSWANDGVFLS